MWPDISDSICRKHDVALASLQRFAGQTAGVVNGDELDEAWNPRNKHLADAVFLADIRKHDCHMPSVVAEYFPLACPLPAQVGPSFLTLAGWMHFGVNKINDKDWPFTSQDIKHAEGLHRFVGCAAPLVTELDIQQKRGVLFTATWQITRGCTGLTIRHHVISLFGYSGASAYAPSSIFIPRQDKVIDEIPTTTNMSIDFEVWRIEEVPVGSTFTLILAVTFEPNMVQYGGNMYPVRELITTFVVTSR